MKKLSILALALSVLAASCTKEVDEMGSGRGKAGEIRVSAMVNGITKATTDGAVTTFENGDQLSLYVWTGDNTAVPADPWINGEVNTYNSETKKWDPANLMLWQNGTDPHYFLGVYPARAITNFTADPFEQTASYEASDLLVGTILGDGVVATTDPIPLVMDHLMAKLKVTLTLRNQWSGDPEVHVYVKAAYTGTVDYLSKTITPGNDITTFGFDGLGEGFQSTLIIPQEGVTEITVTVNGTKYVYTHPTSIPLTKGHVTTLPLIVGKDAIVLADEGITVEGWTAGELPEGLGGDAVYVPNATDLATIKENHIASDGETLSGTLDVEHYPVKISIADGATVTLDGVSILGVNDENYKWAGITCEGDATIILKEGSVNSVMGFYLDAPGIFIPKGKTLIIKGEGSLTASTYIADPSDIDTYGYGAGIGGGKDVSCGNIEIQGGNIEANGGVNAAGIGTGGIENENSTNCGTIKISGGSVVATSKYQGAGIGCGYSGICDIITISGGTVEATGGYSGPGIGSTVGDSQCGDITISGGTVTATTSNSAPGIGSSIEPSVCGNIIISGGTVTAIGKGYSPGIGAGGSWFKGGSCGNITITSGVTKVTAIKGVSSDPSDPPTPNSIGSGLNATSCGTVTIGGVVGAITDSPYVYPISYPVALSEVITSGYVGSVITSDGNVYKKVSDATAANKTAVAVIAYVGTAGSVDASSDTYKGLAIAMSNAVASSAKWSTESNKYKCLSNQAADITAALGDMNGISNTSTLIAAGHSSHGHAAATAAASNNDTAAPTGTSGWFLPSLGQWNLIVQGLASKKAGAPVTVDLTESENNTYKAANLNSVITAAGGNELNSDSQWSSTEKDDGNAWRIRFNNGNAEAYKKDGNIRVRSVFAF